MATDSPKGGANHSDEELIKSRVSDAFFRADKYCAPRFVGFLDQRQRKIALRAAQMEKANGCRFSFWGGFEQAERVLLGVFPDFMESAPGDFPVLAVVLQWKFGSLTHRDFLGSILSLGLKREKIGDIVVSDGQCVVLANSAIARFIAENLEKVGGSGITASVLRPDEITEIPVEHDFRNISLTIASPRLDCVVAALVSASRSEAERLIQNGSVSVDFEPVTEHANNVSDGSTVSIRGHGRFLVDQIGPKTRKGRFSFSARKYL